jgi:hypothetical protein
MASNIRVADSYRVIYSLVIEVSDGENRWDEKAGLQRDALSSQLSTRLKRGRQGDRR